MINRIKNLISKNNFSNKTQKKELTIEKEIVILKKDNEILKKNLKENALNKFKTRRSIRKFSDQKIDDQIIYEIIEAATNAPCAGNMQDYKIIIIKEKERKIQISKIAFQQFWLADAPILLIITRDNYNLTNLYPKEGKIYAIQNCAAVIENILMLTHFYDLGACWIEACENEVLKEYLNIPSNLVVDAIIPIGYPLENPKISKEPMMQKIFFEKFGNKKK